MAPTLLVLAAGRGSRYGGLKQIDPVGPSGETVLDYAVYDAIRAGFGRVVFVIRRDFEEAFKDGVTAKYEGRIPVGLAYQATDDLPAGCTVPAGRERPWGTGHAVWCARDAVRGPFAVINADDFYGTGSFALLASFLRAARTGRYALVGYRLANTLSENGTVSRGICREKDGLLASITEETDLGRGEVGEGRRFSGEETVSMNCWGFTGDVFPGLEAGLRDFIADKGSDTKAEWYLPAAISGIISSGAATVEILRSADRWFGVTYREDRDGVVAALAERVRSGAYPERLFS